MLLGFVKDDEVRYEDEDQDVSIRDVLHDVSGGGARVDSSISESASSEYA